MHRELVLPPAPVPRAFPFGQHAAAHATLRLPIPAALHPASARTTLPCGVPAAAPVLPFRAPLVLPGPVTAERLTEPTRLVTTPVLPFVTPAAPRIARARGLLVLASTLALGVLILLTLHG